MMTLDEFAVKINKNTQDANKMFMEIAKMISNLDLRISTIENRLDIKPKETIDDICIDGILSDLKIRETK